MRIASTIVCGVLGLGCSPSSARPVAAGPVIAPASAPRVHENASSEKHHAAPEMAEVVEAVPEELAVSLVVLAPTDRTPEAWPRNLHWVGDERLSQPVVTRSSSGDVRVSWYVPLDALDAVNRGDRGAAARRGIRRC